GALYPLISYALAGFVGNLGTPIAQFVLALEVLRADGEGHGEIVRRLPEIIDVIDLQPIQASRRIFAIFHLPTLRVGVMLRLATRKSDRPVGEFITTGTVCIYLHGVRPAVTVAIHAYNFRCEAFLATFIATTGTTRLFTRIFARILSRVFTGILTRILSWVFSGVFFIIAAQSNLVFARLCTSVLRDCQRKSSRTTCCTGIISHG